MPVFTILHVEERKNAQQRGEASLPNFRAQSSLSPACLQLDTLKMATCSAQAHGPHHSQLQLHTSEVRHHII